MIACVCSKDETHHIHCCFFPRECGVLRDPSEPMPTVSANRTATSRSVVTRLESKHFVPIRSFTKTRLNTAFAFK